MITQIGNFLKRLDEDAEDLCVNNLGPATNNDDSGDEDDNNICTDQRTESAAEVNIPRKRKYVI